MLVGLSNLANGNVNHLLGGMAGITAFLTTVVAIKNSGYLQDDKK